MSTKNHIALSTRSQTHGLLIHNGFKKDQSSSLSDSSLALFGWKNAPQPWNERVCKKWIPWHYILQHWPKTRREKLMKGYYAPLAFCEHDTYKRELTRMWKSLCKNEEATKRKRCMIPYWFAAMVYAEVFLNRIVNWNIVYKKHKHSNIIQDFSIETNKTPLSRYISNHGVKHSNANESIPK